MKQIVKEKLIPQVEIVHAEDPDQLQERINALLMLHPDCTDIDIQKDSAIVKYNISVTVQEPDPADTIPVEGEPAIVNCRLDLTEEETEKVEGVCVQLLLPVPENRYCCECSNYTWGTGCRYRTGPIRPMEPACPLLDIHIGHYSDLVPDADMDIELHSKTKDSTLPSPEHSIALPELTMTPQDEPTEEEPPAKKRIRRKKDRQTIITNPDRKHSIKVQQAEAAADQEETDRTYLCRNCPHAELSPLRSVQSCRCQYAPGGMTRQRTPACDRFYKEVRDEIIAPVMV